MRNLFKTWIAVLHFYGNNLKRLSKIKKRYDPDNFFTDKSEYQTDRINEDL
ncbi:MAG: BBE domain-containing protein [Deltaproteobacteria bacterium]|nr:BBE domain-containing protein [Deltaproteobacteria bacterium]